MSNEVNQQASAGDFLSTQKNPASVEIGSLPPQLPAHIQIPSVSQFEESRPPVVQEVFQKLRLPDEQLNPVAKVKTYGAPRVFDLFTLLAITLAFALLFALLGLLAPALDASANEVTVVIGGFVTLVGFSQMWLFGSNNPRVASLVSGPFAFAIVMWLPLSQVTNTLTEAFASTICFGLFIGPIAGYLAGAVVAGVFLLADKFRTSMMTTGTNNKDASFDDVQ